MGCNCGKPAASKANTEFVVTAPNGETFTFPEEPEARIKAVQVNGKVTPRKK